MHQIKKVGLGLLFILFSASNLSAQNTVSPYSAYGVGVVSDRGYTSNIGMGKTGVAYSSPWFVSNLNPALLADQGLTTFEAGLGFRNTAIRDEINRYDQTSGGLNYVAIALPIKPNKLGVAFSLNPYISRQYSISQNFEESNDPIPLTKVYRGSGNISQFRLSAGYKIIEDLSLGFEVNYNFGLTNNDISTRGVIYQGDTISLPYQINSASKNNYSDLSYLFGLRYKLDLKNENDLSFGLTYALPINLKTERSVSLEYLTITGEPLASAGFSQVVSENEEGNTYVPGKLTAGISYFKYKFWTVSADYSFQDWSLYEQFGESSNNLQASNTFMIGGEFIPDFDDADKYLERVTYRAGFSFQQGPVIVNDQSINSFGITFGVTAPISRISNLNAAFEIGQRGTLEEGLVRENYFGINLSFTYNDKWFLRRQFD